MNPSAHLLSPGHQSEKTIAHLQALLSKAGLQVVRSFDLQSSLAVHGDCPCPHHGTDRCTCQWVALLIYGRSLTPLTLVVHGYDRQTWFYPVDTPEQPADPEVLAAIQSALTSEGLTGPEHEPDACDG